MNKLFQCHSNCRNAHFEFLTKHALGMKTVVSFHARTLYLFDEHDLLILRGVRVLEDLETE